MTNLQREIVDLYEQLGLTTPQIAVDRSVEEGFVIAVLAQYSTYYKKGLKEKLSKEIVDDAELEQLKATLKQIALFSTDDNLRAKYCVWLINEKLGRNEQVKINAPTAQGQLANSIALKMLNQARAAVERSLIGNGIPTEVKVISEPELVEAK